MTMASFLRFFTVGFCLLLSSASNATTINVSNSCSLVDAITAANQNSLTNGCPAGEAGNLDTIVLLPNSTYMLSAVNASGGTDGATGLPSVISDIIIEGNGATIERQGANNFRIFHVATSGDLTLEALSIANGHATGSGNEQSGGAIYNLGSLTLNRSSLTDNTADSQGGGIFQMDSASLVVNQSTLSDNHAGDGGAIASLSSTVTMSNSTISNNDAQNDGGGLYIAVSGSMTITHSTITGNGTVSSGGGIAITGGSVTLQNSIVANSVASDDCASLVADPVEQGKNWYGDDTCGRVGDGNPNLAALASNGGITETHALMSDSGAINSANNVICAASPTNGLDQRGEARDDTQCDIGAFEKTERGSLYVVPLKEGAVIFEL